MRQYSFLGGCAGCRTRDPAQPANSRMITGGGTGNRQRGESTVSLKDTLYQGFLNKLQIHLGGR